MKKSIPLLVILLFVVAAQASEKTSEKLKPSRFRVVSSRLIPDPSKSFNKTGLSSSSEKVQFQDRMRKQERLKEIGDNTAVDNA